MIARGVEADVEILVERLHNVEGGYKFIGTMTGLFQGITFVVVSDDLEAVPGLLSEAVRDFQFSDTLLQ